MYAFFEGFEGSFFWTGDREEAVRRFQATTQDSYFCSNQKGSTYRVLHSLKNWQQTSYEQTVAQDNLFNTTNK